MWPYLIQTNISYLGTAASRKSSPPFYIKRDNQLGSRPKAIHSHLGFELGVVLKGQVYRIFKDQEILCKPNDIFLIDCRIPHGNRPFKKQNYEKVFVYLEPEVLLNLLPNKSDLRLMLPFMSLSAGMPSVIPNSKKITDKLIKAHQLAASKNADQAMQGWPVLISALIDIYIEMKPQLTPVLNSEAYQKKVNVIQASLEFMNKNLLTDFSLQELSKQCHLSPSRYRNVFKEIMGIAPMDYRNKLRADKAISEIVQTDQKLSYIAESCGFGSYTQFSQMIRKYSGFSPKDIRLKKAFPVNE